MQTFTHGKRLFEEKNLDEKLAKPGDSGRAETAAVNSSFVQDT